jgi:DNA mismatch repair ATPase MutS
MLHSVDKSPDVRHLCIFDELYSGTNPYEATACGTAFLRFLAKNRNVDFALTTHYTQLCQELGKERCIENVNMECIPVFNGEGVVSDHAYTFRKRKGISTHQGGIKVLKDLGYPESVIADANSVIRSIAY